MKNFEPKFLQLTYDDYKKNKKSLKGMKFDNYIVMKLLGEGAFGSVYKGINDQTKQEVAIKVLDLEAVQKQKSDYVKKIKKRLVKTQSQMMMRCNSQNLVKCYDIYQNKSLKIMIIQYCNGGELQKEINQNGRLPQNQAVMVLQQVLNGLAQMHKNGIVHRDLKPQNILIHDGIYKIADFGFSKDIDSNNQNYQIRQTKLGTITTMAPQVMSNQSYGLQADIWSMGIIFYNMLFGKLPYQKHSYEQVLKQIKRKDIFEPKLIGSSIKISDEAKDFITNCLKLDSKKRLNWKNISQHPLFKKKKAQVLTSAFRRKISLNANQMKSIENRQFEQQDTKSQQAQKEYADLKKTQRPQMISDQQLKKKQKQLIKSKSTQIFNWSKKSFFQCSKSQLILEHIVNPLEKCSEQFTGSRQGIQLLYLLITRCFFNMSFMRVQMKEKNKIQEDLVKSIQTLYGKVSQKFELYSKKLSKKQSQVLQVVFDKITQIFNKEEMQKRDKFFTGLEKSQGVGQNSYSFTKQQQIKFTQKLINQQLKNNQKIFLACQVPSNTLNFMKNYEQICLLQFQSVKDINFYSYVSSKYG